MSAWNDLLRDLRTRLGNAEKAIARHQLKPVPLDDADGLHDRAERVERLRGKCAAYREAIELMEALL